MRDDDTRAVDTQMALLPASFAVSSVFRSSSFPFAQDREPRAVDDEVHACPRRHAIKLEVEVLAAPGERRVIRGGKVDAHHPEERMQEPLRLSEWHVEEETERQCGFDGDVGLLQLPSASADASGSQVAIASGDIHRVTSPRPMRARS